MCIGVEVDHREIGCGTVRRVVQRYVINRSVSVKSERRSVRREAFAAEPALSPMIAWQTLSEDGACARGAAGWSKMLSNASLLSAEQSDRLFSCSSATGEGEIRTR